MGRGATGAPSIGMLSTYPPTRCGLATFSASLANGLALNGADVSVVRVADGSPCASTRVVGELVNGSPASVAAASELLNQSDVAMIHHDYDIYGGAEGAEVVDIVAGLRVPSIVVARTILADPTAAQRSVLVELAAMADQLVVLSDSARRRVVREYGIDASKVTTIPHGATVPKRVPPTARRGRPTLLTWGLLAPGKGVERVIEAMVSLKDLTCQPRYLVAGRTHPKVLAADGESYRTARIEQAERLDVTGSVSFDAAYRDTPTLTALIQSAAAVVLPYDSTEQVTSGVLADAVASGRPVIATAFPHAVELLGTGAGIVVGHDDPDALASALRQVLTEPRLAGTMAAEARRLAPTMAWSVVATAYTGLAVKMLTKRPVVV